MTEKEKTEKKEPEKPAAGGEEKKEGGAKNSKITQMSLAELEKEIENTNKHMGGLTSQYGRMLAARKQVLLDSGAGKK